ncbi:MAG TPA: hypothetical protein VN040_18230 [Pseudosphingobacterium sp.]|nr:hypothetical protein [Pseudosphingobacterium sp.]
MVRIYVISFIVLSVTSCIDRHHQVITSEWFHPDFNKYETPIRFDEISNKKVAQLHHAEVLIHGRLVYEYDETAVHPFFEETGFSPVWLDVKSHESALHQFLLNNHGASVIIQGTLDTAQLIDKTNYSSAIIKLKYVSARSYRKQ